MAGLGRERLSQIRARVRDFGDTRQASLFTCGIDENVNAKKVKQELF